MRKLTLLLLLPWLVSCAAEKDVVSAAPHDGLPIYCVRDIEVFEEEGYAMLDLASLYTDDAPIKISYEHYTTTYVLGEREGAPFCAPEDPRMTQTND